MEAKSRGSVAPNRSRSERRSPESWQELTQRRIPAQLQQTCKRNEQWLRLPGTLHSMSFSREEEMDRTQTKGMDVISYSFMWIDCQYHKVELLVIILDIPFTVNMILSTSMGLNPWNFEKLITQPATGVYQEYIWITPWVVSFWSHLFCLSLSLADYVNWFYGALWELLGSECCSALDFDNGTALERVSCAVYYQGAYWEFVSL